MSGDSVETGGVFAVAGHRAAANLTYLALHASRGARLGPLGLGVSDGSGFKVQRGTGSVQSELAPLASWRGHLAVGVVAAAGATEEGGHGPVLVRGRSGTVVVGMVGALSNGAALRRDLLLGGALFTAGDDAETLAALVARSERRTFVNRLVDGVFQLEGGFAAVVASEDTVCCVRDPWGIRSLWIARVDGAAVASTDASMLVFLGAVGLREVQPGEVVVLDPRGVGSVFPFPKRDVAPCALDLVTLIGADGEASGRTTWEARVGLGRRLAQVAPVAADVVVGLPGAGAAIAAGFAAEAGAPFVPALIAASTTDALVEPAQGLPGLGTRSRLLVVRAAVSGRRVVLVAPVLGWGDELNRVIRLVRDSGAAEVHVRVVARLLGRCPFGVRTPGAREGRERPLDAALGADSAFALEADDVGAALADGASQRAFCLGCLGGRWPLAPAEPGQLDLF